MLIKRRHLRRVENAIKANVLKRIHSLFFLVRSIDTETLIGAPTMDKAVIENEEDDPANQSAERTLTQLQEFITQPPMNLKISNKQPQDTGVQERPSTIQKSNNSRRKRYKREIRKKPTISNQCKSINIFHDFYFKVWS